MKKESICCINNDFSIENLKVLVSDIYRKTKPLCYLHSFGCQQNVTDGEKLKELIKKIGYEFTDNTDNADLIILNTCAVRENAEDRVFGTIGEYKRLKKKSPTQLFVYAAVWHSKSILQSVLSRLISRLIWFSVHLHLIGFMKCFMKY